MISYNHKYLIVSFHLIVIRNCFAWPQWELPSMSGTSLSSSFQYVFVKKGFNVCPSCALCFTPFAPIEMCEMTTSGWHFSYFHQREGHCCIKLVALACVRSAYSFRALTEGGLLRLTPESTTTPGWSKLLLHCSAMWGTLPDCESSHRENALRAYVSQVRHERTLCCKDVCSECQA